MLNKLICAFALLAASASTVASSDCLIPASIDQNGHAMVDVASNGEYLGKGVIDSGASTVVIPESLLSIFKGEYVGEAMASTANGTVPTKHYKGNIEIPGVRVSGVSVSTMNSPGSPILVGQSLLRGLGNWYVDEKDSCIKQVSEGKPSGTDTAPPYNRRDAAPLEEFYNPKRNHQRGTGNGTQSPRVAHKVGRGELDKSKWTWLGSFNNRINAINYKSYLSSNNPGLVFEVISGDGKHRVKSPSPCSQVRNQKHSVGCFMPKQR